MAQNIHFHGLLQKGGDADQVLFLINEVAAFPTRSLPERKTSFPKEFCLGGSPCQLPRLGHNQAQSEFGVRVSEATRLAYGRVCARLQDQAHVFPIGGRPLCHTNQVFKVFTPKPWAFGLGLWLLRLARGSARSSPFARAHSAVFKVTLPACGGTNRVRLPRLPPGLAGGWKGVKELGESKFAFTDGGNYQEWVPNLQTTNPSHGLPPFAYLGAGQGKLPQILRIHASCCAKTHGRIWMDVCSLLQAPLSTKRNHCELF